MHLIINSRNCNSGGGLNRYKGEGIYSSLHRKNTSLLKVRDTEKKDDTDSDLDKKYEGEGIDVVDSPNIDESGSDEKSLIETISDFSEDESFNDDKESKVDDKEVININEETPVEDENLETKSDEKTYEAGFKRKYSPTIVDLLVNNNTVPTKLQCLDSVSVSDCQENYVPLIAEPQSYLTNHDHGNYPHGNDEGMREKSANHHLSLICSTEGKKWPQKKCVFCRRKYGLRKDTRYICVQCNVALCKSCFSDYHCNK